MSNSLGYEQVTALSSVKALSAIPVNPSMYASTHALFKVKGAAVRFLDTGDSPSASVGMPIDVNESFRYDGDRIGSVKFIEITSGAEVNVWYFRDGTWN